MAAVLTVECILLFLLLQKTKIGLKIRAVASNPDSSRLVGINAGRMLMLGWALAAALGALAGSLVAGYVDRASTPASWPRCSCPPSPPLPSAASTARSGR